MQLLSGWKEIAEHLQTCADCAAALARIRSLAALARELTDPVSPNMWPAIEHSLDRAAKKHLLMLSAQGGVEIEAVAESDPDAIVMLYIDPVDGISLEAARHAAIQANIVGAKYGAP